MVVRVKSDATVEVEDHGQGVAPADREMIFDPVWKMNDASPGTGLGFAIVRERIEKHEGRISVEETLGGRPTFKVSPPRSDERGAL